MKILMVSSELAPLAKTGGLADAVTGLSNALVARGHDVRVLMPKYEHLPPPDARLEPVVAAVKHRCFELVRGTLDRPASAARAPAGGTPRVYLVDLGELTPGPIYFGDDRDAGRFVRLAEAAVELGDALGWQPDLLHCHDWHAALVPLVLDARRPDRPLPTVLTVHNIGYQGVFGDHVLSAHGADDLRSVAHDALRGGAFNFLRAGLRTADLLTTVSPTYAREIRTPAFGMGLEDVLNDRADSLVGILNGVDYGVWDPGHDPFIETHYGAKDVSPKYRLKGLLEQHAGLAADRNAPLVGAVSRLAHQKGIDLVAGVLPTLVAATRANFVFLGNGDATVAAELKRLAAAHPRRIAFTERYDERLAHWILGGADIALVPSRYEPCGLTQLYALRYGTVPVVRATGGLADTIEHFDPATGSGNGSVFRDADTQGFLWGVRCALEWFDDPAAWSRLMANGMAADYSWSKQVPRYEELYGRLVD